VAGSSSEQIAGAWDQLFQRTASWRIGPLLWAVPVLETTKPAPGPTNENERVGWRPPEGAGRAVPPM
jgi:hypothetical protein